MRAILILTLFVIAVPYCLAHAEYALALWYWTSLFQPQSQTFGFGPSVPYSLIAAFATLISLLFTKGPKRPPVSALTVLLILFVIWTGITTIFAAYPGAAYVQWDQFWKLITMVLLGFMIIQSKDNLNFLIWVICTSVGYYGFKLGLFGLQGGMGKDFRGPTYMDANNELVRGMLMILPLLAYLFRFYKQTWIRVGIAMVSLLSIVTVIMSNSRGGWLAAFAMLAFVLMRVRRGILWLTLTCLVGLAIVPLLPDQIVARFYSIQDYKSDSSVQGRFDSWNYAFKKFPERPILGGGFLVLDLENNVAPHNSFVQVVAEHGSVGLAIFVGLLGAAAAISASIRRKTKAIEELAWANDLAFAVQVILVGYVVGSLSINHAYFPVLYAVFGVLGSLQIVVAHQLAANPERRAAFAKNGRGWHAAAP